LEEFAVQFDSLFHNLAQRQAFRTYLSGLLMPRDRSKTLTALVGAEPLVQAQAAKVQRLQFFLSEASWNAEAITAQRLTLLLLAKGRSATSWRSKLHCANIARPSGQS
jgi:SRSO17 transposase